ncbi:hypothetical protein AB833_29865 [Chromatiales bacterium (ex Bugula neritina AB1)]|nr:hypothetical protein AB833_29865 [Chromatiales bacterium (ex Bugula neritina AB1)]
MSYIIDRRLNSKDKSAVNRQRFIRRYRKHIKKAVSDAVSSRSIMDMERGESISIPQGDISEPSFRHAPGGYRARVLPGNKEFQPGDRIKRPDAQSGGGPGKGQASDSGEGMDEFVFQITQSEFLEFMFEDLELPNLIKRQLTSIENFNIVKAGISEEGTPNQMNVVRTMRSAYARRIAMGGRKKRRRKEILAILDTQDSIEESSRLELQEELEALDKRLASIPYIDDFDLKFNVNKKEPQPSSKAVMFCLMDVSGSMDQRTKDIAKRFFILLYLFLQRNYRHTEVVFIRHHSTAKEVEENEFFYSRETGGTVVSSALKLMQEIIADRFSVEEWNIYGAQASDGDNWTNDSPICHQLLEEKLLPVLQYYCYLEITDRGHQELWQYYEKLADSQGNVFAMRGISDYADIYPVFRDLFCRDSVAGVAQFSR